MTDWTIYNNLLPWYALTVEQMRAFEASEGEMIWLTSDGGWHPINPPVAPGWIIRVAELAIEDLIEEHEKHALAPQPEADPVREPTEAMLDAARDWSKHKYGKPIGNDAAIGCWQVMFDAQAASQPAPAALEQASACAEAIRALSPTPQAGPAVTCNRCGWQGGEDDLIATLDERDGEPSRACPECRTDNYLMDVQLEADPVREAVEMPRAWLDVMGERTRQIAVEGWDDIHDDCNDRAELAQAAACYALSGTPADEAVFIHGRWNDPRDLFWPWDRSWWKPTDRRRDLVKAGALILAEIERLDRSLAQKGE